MQKLHYSIKINAPREKVYQVMLDDETFREWTKPFAPGSYYEGSWKKGSKIKFIDPDRNAGMVSVIVQNRKNEFVSIRHLGIIEKGVEDTTSEKAKVWVGARENYTFGESDGGTLLEIDADTADEYVEMFNKLWPEALSRLKEIAEGHAPRTIIVASVVKASMVKVWENWNKPEHIVHWAFASDDWEAPHAANDLRDGGKFKTVMAAKDGSQKFDFTGTYTALKEHSLIEYDMDDGRHVKVHFNEFPDGGVQIIEIFEPEKVNPPDLQAKGWQAILGNFKKYVESNK